MIPTHTAPDALERARDLVAPALKTAIDRLSGEVRLVAEYHFGWCDAEGHPVGGGDSGKGVRPALAVLSAEVVGASAVFGIPAGVAVELVHNFSLIHDDVIDGDAERRHRPSVWSVFGVGRAVIVGDALLALAQQVVLDPSGALQLVGGFEPEMTARAARRMSDATASMIAGQALDMAYETADEVDFEECLAMEAGKTGALLSCASALGAELAGANPDNVAALARFGLELGLAFQAVDDLLGIWGDPMRTGKPSGSDLRQKKKTLPVVSALAAGGADADELAELLLSATFGDDETARAAELVEKAGGRSATADEARRRLDTALKALEEPGFADRPRQELADVARFVVEREF